MKKSEGIIEEKAILEVFMDQLYYDTNSCQIFMSSYEAIQKAVEDVNKNIAQQDTELKWINKEEYDVIAKQFSDLIYKSMNEMLDNYVIRNLQNILTEFFKELGFDESIAEAKAHEGIFYVL